MPMMTVVKRWWWWEAPLGDKYQCQGDQKYFQVSEAHDIISSLLTHFTLPRMESFSP
jgi:hypothetical protein